MLGKLASMFVEIEGGTPPPQQQAEQAQTQAPAAAPTPAPAAQPTTPHPVPVVPASVDESMVEFLAQAVEEANLPGFDYIEFRNALAQMASAQLPEQQKFIAVFATASTMGLTKEKLFEAINHYQGVLDSKKQEFQAHVEHMTQQDIVAREERKAAIEAEIQSLTEQIQEAQQAIAQKHQETMEISNEINQERLNIQNTAASFEATYSFVSGKLQEDKRKIETYIA